MDEATGLLDRLSNPRPAFVAARTLNTILFAAPPAEPYQPVALPADLARARVLVLAAGEKHWWLVLPSGADEDTDAERIAAYVLTQRPAESRSERPTIAGYHLAEATSEVVEANAPGIVAALERAPGPSVLITQP
jgi:hypothetical protein